MFGKKKKNEKILNKLAKQQEKFRKKSLNLTSKACYNE